MTVIAAVMNRPRLIYFQDKWPVLGIFSLMRLRSVIINALDPLFVPWAKMQSAIARTDKTFREGRGKTVAGVSGN